jgi:hypothetical protein
MGRLTFLSGSPEQVEAKAGRVLAHLGEYQRWEGAARRRLPGLLAERLAAGEEGLVMEALRRWSDGEEALTISRWLGVELVSD